MQYINIKKLASEAETLIKTTRQTDGADEHDLPFLDTHHDAKREAVKEEIALLPFMRYYHAYAASPVAKRLTESQLAPRRRSWRSLATWMRQNHPEISDLASITRSIGEDYMDALKDNFSNTTCNIYLCCIKEVFGHLARETGLKFNPWDVVRRLPNDTMARRELTPDEIGRLISIAQRHGGEWALLFRLAAYTGMRLGECCNLEWKNVVMEKDLIQFIPSKTRGKVGYRPVTVPLHRELKRHLLRIPANLHWGPLMPALAADYSTSRTRLQKTIARIFAEAGIKSQITIEGRKRKVSHASFHSIRHSFVSFTANAGIPLEIVRAMVGHGNTGMTRHYYHADENALWTAIASIPIIVSG